MTPREVIRTVLAGERPPYVPWSFSFTFDAWRKLEAHYGGIDVEAALGNHILLLKNSSRHFQPVDENRTRDAFGVLWNQAEDRDIGVVEGCVLAEPTLDGFTFPDPLDDRFALGAAEKVARYPDRFRMFNVGFSLFERAWTLRGMENLLTDFYEAPSFVHELFDQIADYNIEQIRSMSRFGLDAVCFGDDWGQQRGLIVGRPMWREFILPRVRRMYAAVHDAGMAVFAHSCGDVGELFDDLIEAGLDCFNPFQPEVMDVKAVLGDYRRRLCFFGGLSTQRTLPYGSPEDVRAESERLMDLGREGGYIFAPAHAVKGDVPVENMLAFIECAHAQARAAGFELGGSFTTD